MALVVAPGKAVSCKLKGAQGVIVREGEKIPANAIVDVERLERLNLVVADKPAKAAKPAAPASKDASPDSPSPAATSDGAKAPAKAPAGKSSKS